MEEDDVTGDGAATSCPIDEETEGDTEAANIVPNGEANKTDRHEKNGRASEASAPCQTLEALVDGYNIVSVDPTFPGNLDQVSILRRYMMDLAEFEEDFELRDRLGSAPDVAFRNPGPKASRRETVKRRLTLKSAMLTQYRSSVSSARRSSITNGKTDLSQLPLTKSGRAHAYFQKRTILSAATQTAAASVLHDHRFHNPLELPSMQQQQQHAKKSTSSKASADKAGYSVFQGLNNDAHNKAVNRICLLTHVARLPCTNTSMILCFSHRSYFVGDFNATSLTKQPHSTAWVYYADSRCLFYLLVDVILLT